MSQEETLEGMGLRDILVLLQSISYAKADHIEQQDYELGRELINPPSTSLPESALEA